MPKREMVGRGGSRKVGRNRDKCKLYRARKTRERNKLKRILQSNGARAANKYAKLHDLSIRFT